MNLEEAQATVAEAMDPTRADATKATRAVLRMRRDLEDSE